MRTGDNQYTYLVGYRDNNGEFWCWGEFKDEQPARNSYKFTCYDYSDRRIELIRQVATHEILETCLPLDCLDGPFPEPLP